MNEHYERPSSFSSRRVLNRRTALNWLMDAAAFSGGAGSRPAFSRLAPVRSFRDRIGFDAGQRPVEKAVEFAIRHQFHYLDFNADRGPNHLDSWDKNRVRNLRQRCLEEDIQLGLHTLSAVNVAEFSPRVSEAVDEYLLANLELAHRLGCSWMIVHAGFHFSSDEEARRQASLDRLQRLADLARQTGVRPLLENLNREPELAEVHYLAHNVNECRFFFDSIPADRLGWAFPANHAHLVPEGIGGFLDALGLERIGEVRLADNTGEYEVHLVPGQGTIDFVSLFRRLEGSGYAGHYMMAFGTDEEKLKARDFFASLID